jgi:hypothetical protein
MNKLEELKETCIGSEVPPASGGFLLGALFDPEDGGDMFLRTQKTLSPTHSRKD